MLAYHFTGDTLRDGRPIPPIGEWLVHEGPVTICETGLHASRHPFDALGYAPGPRLHLVECDDIVAERPDKLVCRRRKIVKSIDATQLLRDFARWCDAALGRREETQRLDAAWAATAWDSAWSAAWAAMDAARAAWAAERAALRTEFQRRVDEAFA